MKFNVRLLDTRHMTISQELMELSSPDALGAIAQDGRRVLSVEPIDTDPRGIVSRRRVGIDIAWWCQELRTLLKAGMTVVEAIETLQTQVTEAGREDLQGELLRNLRQGQSLSVAMQSMDVFPMVLVASIRASERTSSLAEALTEYLRYQEMVDALRKKVISAAIYPCLVLGLGLVVSSFLLIVVLPRFAAMYADLRGAMTWSTQLLVVTSRFVHAHQMGLVVALVLLVLGGVVAWQAGVIQAAAARLGAQVGPIQRAMQQFQLAKLYHSMTVMFRGGYTLEEVLLRCEGLSLGAQIDQGLADARAALNRGVKVSTALSDVGLTDPVTQRLLAVGERAGNFERVLQTIADRHAGRFATFMDRATRIVEPLMLLLVALLVGSIVVLMYLPIFDIASSIR